MLIVIESGTDASGKQTQTELLYQALCDKQLEVTRISFPDYESPSSALVRMYLAGDFGDKAKDVNPYISSTFYAVDRYASFQTKWKQAYQAGHIILADRYTTSNMIHQGVKIKDPIERKKYLNWLIEFEYDTFELPRPDLVLFLDVPYLFSQKLLKKRAYQKKSPSLDIHERDENYLEQTYQNAISIANEMNWQQVTCVDQARMLTPLQIHQVILEILQQKGVIDS